MILSEMRDYLHNQKRASIKDIALHFEMDADATRGLLAVWIKKGKIKNSTAGGAACGTSCCQCDPLVTEIYEWIEN
jgi:putative ferrous iron transport protein C